MCGKTASTRLAIRVTQVNTRVAKLLTMKPGNGPVDMTTLATTASLVVSVILWHRVSRLQREATGQRAAWRAWREEHPRPDLHVVEDSRRPA